MLVQQRADIIINHLIECNLFLIRQQLKNCSFGAKKNNHFTHSVQEVVVGKRNVILGMHYLVNKRGSCSIQLDSNRQNLFSQQKMYLQDKASQILLEYKMLWNNARQLDRLYSVHSRGSCRKKARWLYKRQTFKLIEQTLFDQNKTYLTYKIQ